MIEPATFVKKPVAVKAMKYTVDNAREVGLFVGEADVNQDGQFLIHTLEGVMKTDHGDWVIQGIKGEFYPCKPDIFEQTYTRELQGELPWTP